MAAHFETYSKGKPMEQDQLVKIYSDFRAIERDLHELSLILDFTDINAKTRSPLIRKITLAACASIENVSKYIAKEINVSDEYRKIKHESQASYIFKFMKKAGYPLDILITTIQFRQNKPWALASTFHDEDLIRFKFWDTYNDYKHNEFSIESNCETLKLAIDSVSALFTLVFFLTSNTAFGIFWNRSDFIQLSTDSNPLARNIYTRQCSPKKAIWG